MSGAIAVAVGAAVTAAAISGGVAAKKSDDARVASVVGNHIRQLDAHAREQDEMGAVMLQMLNESDMDFLFGGAGSGQQPHAPTNVS